LHNEDPPVLCSTDIFDSCSRSILASFKRIRVWPQTVNTNTVKILKTVCPNDNQRPDVMIGAADVQTPFV